MLKLLTRLSNVKWQSEKVACVHVHRPTRTPLPTTYTGYPTHLAVLFVPGATG